MRYTVFDIPILNSLLRWFSLGALKASGWRKEGRVPNINKYVVIAAPHTSNWDLPIGLMLAFAFRVKVRWMGKDSLFRGPFCTIFKWLGGIPVDRRKSTGAVARSVETFEKEDKMAMIIAPEGTRRSGGHWKSGFYQIARGAKAPIVLGFLDYTQGRRNRSGDNTERRPRRGHVEDSPILFRRDTETSRKGKACGCCSGNIERRTGFWMNFEGGSDRAKRLR